MLGRIVTQTRSPSPTGPHERHEACCPTAQTLIALRRRTLSQKLPAALAPEMREALLAVIKAGVTPRISVYLPVTPPPDAAQNEVLRRQVVDAAAKRLTALGVNPLDSARSLERLEASLRELAHQAPARGTLVGFASGPEVRCVSLAAALPLSVSVRRCLVLRPLLWALQIEGPYRVLTVSTKQVALFEGDARGVRRAEQGALPKSLEDALGSEKTEKQLRVRGTGPAGHVPVYYTHHNASQERKIDLQRFHHAIAAAINARVAKDVAPLVLVADTTHQSGLRAELRVPALIEAPVTASPDNWTDAQVHAQAWPQVERARLALCSAEPGSWERARNTGKGIDLLDDIATAAVAGRIRRLWLEGERALPGRVDLGTGRLSSGAPDDDILESLAEIVICHDGEVGIVTGSVLPSKSGAAAELR